MKGTHLLLGIRLKVVGIMYKRFAALLVKNNSTAYKVSKNTGITQTTLSNWKKGKSTPKIDKLMKLADYFDVSIEYFLSERESRGFEDMTEKHINISPFSEHLRELRKEKKLTQAELAAIFGKSSSLIANYEVDLRKPSIEMLIILSNFFKVSTDYLLGLSDYRNFADFQDQSILSLGNW
jgi:transcriptional regulator with XRE-family HTH domain